MDFLEIRRKAKERAASGVEAGGASTPGAAGAPAAEPAPAEPPARPAPPRAPSPQDPRLEAEALAAAEAARTLAAQVQELAAHGEEREGEPDPRFTTWRPGSGERPFIPEPEPPPTPVPAPSDFAVIAPPLLDGSPAAAGPLSIAAAAAPAPAAAAPPPEQRPEPVRAASPARWSPAPARNPLEEFFYREDEELPGLVSLPGDGEHVDAASHEDTAIEEYLTFELGAEEYAVAIDRVREVLKAQTITEVPRAPAGILGVVTVRGEVVAVFDPRRRLGLPGSTPPDGVGRIVIVDDGEGPCGLLVDAVASVVRLARGSIEPCPQGIGGASADCLAGIGRERDRLFTVLDLGALLRRAPTGPRAGRSAHAGA
jgi:purine-binding chemotaxis protein CheW